jgi:hypothetical protein
MYYRRIASLLLGFWLGGSLFMAWMAIDSFRSVDRMLTASGPVAAIQINALGPGVARALLRYQAAEQNRSFFAAWELLQLILGIGFFSLMLFGSNEGKVSLLVLLLMLLIVVAQRLFMTPELTSLSRIFDFAPDFGPASTPSIERNRFWMVHSIYTGSEILKWGLGLVLGARLILHRERRSIDAGHEFDVIDKANHRHVNR